MEVFRARSAELSEAPYRTTARHYGFAVKISARFINKFNKLQNELLGNLIKSIGHGFLRASGTMRREGKIQFRNCKLGKDERLRFRAKNRFQDL